MNRTFFIEEYFSRALEISRQLYCASSNYRFLHTMIQPLGVPVLYFVFFLCTTNVSQNAVCWMGQNGKKDFAKYQLGL